MEKNIKKILPLNKKEEIITENILEKNQELNSNNSNDFNFLKNTNVNNINNNINENNQENENKILKIS